MLQEQEVEPLGSNAVQRIDVRIIAATSRDLPAMVAAGSFRADLFYRLDVLPIRLPALRERLADLEGLWSTRFPKTSRGAVADGRDRRQQARGVAPASAVLRA